MKTEQLACAPHGAARPRFDFLHGVRGLAALYVTAFHLLGNSPWPDRWPLVVQNATAWLRHGYLAVDVFIVLSGFLLMLPAVRSQGSLPGGLLQFFKRRAWRILPAYYGAYAASLLFWPVLAVLLRCFTPNLDREVVRQQTLPYTWDNIAAHILLIHPFKMEWITAANGMLWTVGVEWHIYFVFALILLPVWRYTGVIGSLTVAYLIGLAPVYFVPSVSYTFPWLLGLFALGMTGAVIVASPDARWQKLYMRMPWGTLSILFGIGLVWLISARPYFYKGLAVKDMWPIDTLGGLCAVAGIVFLTRSHAAWQARCGGSREGAAVKQPVALRLLNSAPVTVLSHISYSLYLTHGLVVVFLVRVLPLCGFSHLMCALLMMLLGIPLSLALGYFFYLMFERPFLPAGSAYRLEIGLRERSRVVLADFRRRLRLAPGKLSWRRDCYAMGVLTGLFFLLLFKPWEGSLDGSGPGSSWLAVLGAGDAGERPAAAVRLAVALLGVACGFLTLALVYASCRMMFRRGPSLLAALGVVFASPLLASMYLSSGQGYALSAFAASLLVYLSLRYRKFPHAFSYGAIAAVGILVVLTGRHNGVLLLLPLGIWTRHLLQGGFLRTVQRDAYGLACGIAAAAALLALQIAVSRIVTGNFQSAASTLGSFSWPDMGLGQILFGGQRGLFYWHPLLLAGAAGLVVAGAGRAWRAFGLLSLFIFSVSVCTSGSAGNPAGGLTFGAPQFLPLLPLLAFGMAAGLSHLNARRIPFAAGFVAAGVVMNVLLLVLWQRGLLDAWFFSDLWRLKGLVPGSMIGVILTLPLDGYVGTTWILDGRGLKVLAVVMPVMGMIAVLARLLAGSRLSPAARPGGGAMVACSALILMTAPLVYPGGTPAADSRRSGPSDAMRFCVQEADGFRKRSELLPEIRWASLGLLLNPVEPSLGARMSEIRRAQGDEEGAHQLTERRMRYLRARIDAFSNYRSSIGSGEALFFERSGLAGMAEELALREAKTGNIPRALRTSELLISVLPYRQSALRLQKELLAEGDLDSSELSFEKLRELVDVRIARGDIIPAARILQQRLERHPGDKRLAYLLNNTLSGTGISYTILGQIAELDGGEGQFRSSLGAAFFRLNHYGKAEQEFRQAITSGGDDGYTCFLLGRTLLAQKKDSEALLFYRKAFEKQPEFAPTGRFLVEALEKSGNLQEAREVLTSAVALHPADSSLRSLCQKLNVALPD